MTFAELKLRLTDRHGITVDSGVAGRIVNDAIERVAIAANWKELEFESVITFTNGSPTVTLGTDVRGVVSVLNASGAPLDEKDRDAWDDYYEGDTSTGTPTVYCEYGANSSGTIIIKLWPTPNATTSGKLRGLRRMTPLTADGDIPALPPELHHLIAKEAIAMYREYEESELSPITDQMSEQRLNRTVAVKSTGLMSDKT